jgi:hypothetical protein
MRTNPFYDAWLFLTGSTGEHAASGVGWLLTVLYLALLIASIAIAYRNWRQDASQRTMGHLATWFMRVFVVTNAGRSLGLNAVIARKPFGPFARDGLLARVYPNNKIA